MPRSSKIGWIAWKIVVVSAVELLQRSTKSLFLPRMRVGPNCPTRLPGGMSTLPLQ